MRGSQTFSNGLQLSEYVQVVCRNMNETCLKSVSKTPTFWFFLGFPAIPASSQISQIQVKFGSILAKQGHF